MLLSIQPVQVTVERPITSTDDDFITIAELQILRSGETMLYCYLIPWMDCTYDDGLRDGSMAPPAHGLENCVSISTLVVTRS